MEPDGKHASKVLLAVIGKFYERITAELTPEERIALSDRVKEETKFPEDLGSEIRQAAFTFVCPDTRTLVSVKGFVAHGNINPETGDIEAVITVDCKACNKEHPIMVISLPEMLMMPELIEPHKT